MTRIVFNCFGRMMSKAKAKEPSKGGMPRFIPTDEDRALVKLLIANGYAQHLICQGG